MPEYEEVSIVTLDVFRHIQKQGNYEKDEMLLVERFYRPCLG